VRFLGRRKSPDRGRGFRSFSHLEKVSRCLNVSARWMAWEGRLGTFAPYSFVAPMPAATSGYFRAQAAGSLQYRSSPKAWLTRNSQLHCRMSAASKGALST
jgi:hypothetical protein